MPTRNKNHVSSRIYSRNDNSRRKEQWSIVCRPTSMYIENLLLPAFFFFFHYVITCTWTERHPKPSILGNRFHAYGLQVRCHLPDCTPQTSLGQERSQAQKQQTTENTKDNDDE